MAAHSLRILSEMFGKMLTEENRRMYLTALDYAPGMGELELDDWRKIEDALENTSVGTFDFEDILLDAIATQAVEWVRLGKPRAHFEWVNKKYPNIGEG